MKQEWDMQFIELAKHVATWSKDPSMKIGAVIVDEQNRVVSMGYNGFARGVKDSDKRLNDKEMKRLLMLHAEENAILYAKRDLSKCSIYLSGYPPCVHCASLIIQSGIKNIYYLNTKGTISSYWKENIDLAKVILKEAGVKIREV